MLCFWLVAARLGCVSRAVRPSVSWTYTKRTRSKSCQRKTVSFKEKRINQTNSNELSSRIERVKDEKIIPESSHWRCTRNPKKLAQSSHWVYTCDKSAIQEKGKTHRWYYMQISTTLSWKPGQNSSGETCDTFFFLGAAWVSPISQRSEEILRPVYHMIATNRLTMQGLAQKREEVGQRKLNGGRGPPGNTLDQRQRILWGVPWDGEEKKRK